MQCQNKTIPPERAPHVYFYRNNNIQQLYNSFHKYEPLLFTYQNMQNQTKKTSFSTKSHLNVCACTVFTTKQYSGVKMFPQKKMTRELYLTISFIFFKYSIVLN